MCKYTFVNKETCIACGTCGEIAPELFDYDEDGYAFAVLDNNEGTLPVPEEFHEDLEDAFESCPSDSIKMTTSSSEAV